MCPPSAFQVGPSTIEPSSFITPTPISKAAYDLASSLLHPTILNHSIRTYLYARALAEAQGSIYHINPTKKDLLFAACILHDIGTTDMYNGPNRFEVDGADAAVASLEKHEVGEQDRMEVWKANALHTCDGIVQRMGELSTIVRKAVEIDFKSLKAVGVEGLEESTAKFEGWYPRDDIEKVLGDAVVRQAIKNPAKAPSASWPGVMYRSYLENPDWQGVNNEF